MSRLAQVIAVLTILVCSSARADQAGRLLPASGPDNYNYVPSVMMGTDNVQKVWWCGGPTDTIFYMAIDLSTGQYVTPPTAVLREGPPGTWDSVFVCDPSVTRGYWANPVGNGVNYSYAMYYTGTDDPYGHNGVGVAFSNDGINWDKFPFPLYRNSPTNPDSYGVGEQSVLSASGGSEIWLFVVNAEHQPQTLELYHSNDGLHLDFQSTLSTAGLIPNGSGVAIFNEPDFAFDDNTGNLYCVTNRTDNEAIIDVYRIPWGQKETGTWQYLSSLGPGTSFNPTGQNVNADAGLLRNEFGRNGPFLPTVESFFATGPGGGPYSSVQPSDIWWWETTVP